MKKWLMVIIVLSLLAIVLPACGGDGDKSTPGLTETISPTTTPASTATATATPTPNASGPVKIGGINPWSGAAAMSGMLANDVIKLAEWQVKQQGGILGGREVKVVKYDNRASVPEVQAGFRKLYHDEKVSAIVWGGITIPEFNAGATMAEELKILFVPTGEVDNLADLKFTVNAQTPKLEWGAAGARIMTQLLKPTTVGFLGIDNKDGRDNCTRVKKAVEAAGVKTIYEDYVPLEATDYSPYLTKIKYEKPDVLYTYCSGSEFYINIAKQIMELGGWGDIKLIAYPGAENAKKMPGAQGWYLMVVWAPGMDLPAATKFYNDFKTVNGKAAIATDVYFYNCLMTAVYAIDLAGTDTDRVAIAQAARSGNLEWDTPGGHAHLMPDGSSGLSVNTAQIQDSNLVYIPLPEQ